MITFWENIIHTHPAYPIQGFIHYPERHAMNLLLYPRCWDKLGAAIDCGTSTGMSDECKQSMIFGEKQR